LLAALRNPCRLWRGIHAAQAPGKDYSLPD
jgi:hypothetical protein